MLPAYAGMIPSGAVSCCLCSCAPRVCGDDPDTELYLPCSFDDYHLENVDDLKHTIENDEGLFWSSIDAETELDQLYYDLFKESI